MPHLELTVDLLPRKEWELGTPISGVPAEPGVYVFECWEDAAELAWEDWREQFSPGNGPPFDSLEVFLDPATEEERSLWGVLVERYVGEGVSLSDRLKDYVAPASRAVPVRDAHGKISQTERIGTGLRRFIEFDDLRADDDSDEAEYYAAEAQRRRRERLSTRAVTVSFATHVKLGGSIEPTPLADGALRILTEAALVVARPASVGGASHAVLNRYRNASRVEVAGDTEFAEFELFLEQLLQSRGSPPGAR